MWELHAYFAGPLRDRSSSSCHLLACWLDVELHAFVFLQVGDHVAGEGNGDFRSSTGVEGLKPLLEGAAAVRVCVLPHFDHDLW
jgi:hypothetical protein